jgi:hypothetical protein
MYASFLFWGDVGTHFWLNSYSSKQRPDQRSRSMSCEWCCASPFMKSQYELVVVDMARRHSSCPIQPISGEFLHLFYVPSPIVSRPSQSVKRSTQASRVFILSDKDILDRLGQSTSIFRVIPSASPSSSLLPNAFANGPVSRLNNHNLSSGLALNRPSSKSTYIYHSSPQSFSLSC